MANFREKWIAELEADIAAMGGEDGFTSSTADGARLCSAIVFGEYSLKLDKLRTIKVLHRDLGATASVVATQTRIDVELSRIREDRTLDEWPENRKESAVASFLAVAKQAGILKGDK